MSNASDFVIENGVLEEYNGKDAEIVIPNGVTRIENAAFDGNKTITSVTMPDTVTAIGSCAFRKCSKLKSVVFSNALEEIGYDAFIDCKALKSVELPKTLRSLGSGVFGGCTKLTAITCESEVFEAGSNPFEGTFSAACTQLADKQGFLIFCRALYAYYGIATDVVIPDGVKVITGGAFSSGSLSSERKVSLSSVMIPDSVEKIGNYAFSGNKKLKSIQMPSGVEIGKAAFNDCNGLADENGFFIFNDVAYTYFGNDENVVVADGVKELSACLFKNKKIHSVKLPDSLLKIGASAFSGCSHLETVVIPEGIKEIGSEAFENCECLSEITIPDTVERMGDGVFIGCKGLADENGFVFKNHALHAFFGAGREIIIPEGITEIANDVFNNTGILSVKLPSTLRKLGSAFTGCSLLTEISIPEGVNEIKRSAFSGCRRLEKVSLPESLTLIDDYAFEGCELLSEINIPVGVKKIGKSAFRLCASLKEIEIPNGVSCINWTTFQNCKSLSKVYLPESVKVIDGAAFEGCTSLEEVTIPDTIEEIKYFAFKDCTSLKTVNYHNMLGTVAIDAFENCDALIDKNGMVIIAKVLWRYTGDGGDLTVPDGIEAIAPNVFREGEIWIPKHPLVRFRPENSLHSITLPDSLKRIGKFAFCGCKALHRIAFSNALEEIGESSFSDCESLSEIVLPNSVVKIGAKAFSGCKSLKTFYIPASVKSIGTDFVRGCGSLTAINVDESSEDYSSDAGVLYNNAGEILLYVPGGQNLKNYTIPQSVKSIGAHAFIDCLELGKIVIPATVENIGDEAFPRKRWNSKPKLKNIEVSPEAGSGKVGENVFDIMEADLPIVYPKLPVTFVREHTTQVCLALGYCKNPGKYEGEYAEIYRNYAQSHQKTLLNKAKQQKLKTVEQFLASLPKEKKDKKEKKAATRGGYQPELSLKKPNELQKVEILEEVVQKGTLEDLKAVLKTYKTFEITARALALAARYRGVEFVRELVSNGATFKYQISTSLQRKYTITQKTAAGSYSTEYYLILVPAKLDLEFYDDLYYEYDYTPMCGVSHMNISDELEKKALPLKDRIEVTKFISANNDLGVSLDEMLFWALTRSELDFADALIEMGVDLQKTPPTYYSSWGGVPTYMETITSAGQSLYWSSYVTEMTKLSVNQVLPVFERFSSLAVKAGKKLALSQKLFDEMKWNDDSLAFALENMDFSKVNQKKALEKAVSESFIAALAKMADAGWLNQTSKRENLIKFAQNNNCHEALAWLMDFKNRTVDVAAEEAKEEAKLMKEFTENPNSVTALKKIWSYKKQEDGTLIITSYKGSETEVVIPAVIGKAKVTAIGEDAFSASSWGRTPANIEVRKKIISVTIPEGVTVIKKSAFYGCPSLVSVKLPDTLKTIESVAFRECKKLKTVSIPKGIQSVDVKAFWNCDALQDENGFAVIDGMLFGYYGKDTALKIPDSVKTIVTLSTGYSSGFGRDDGMVSEIILPEGLEEIGESAFEEFKKLTSISIPASVKTIGNKAFYKSGVKTVVLREGLEAIGAGAFALTPVETVRVPQSVKVIGAQAFYGCSRLRDFYISAKTEKLYKEVLGTYDSNKARIFGKPSGIYVHTPSGSAAEEYMKQYSGVHVVNDYDE